MRSFRFKILIPLLLLTTLIFALLIFFISSSTVKLMEDSLTETTRIITDSLYSMTESIYSGIEHEKEEKMRETKKRLLHLCDQAVSIMDDYNQRYKSGELSLKEAQRQAGRTIRNLRYGPDGYFWVDNTEYILQIHPLTPEKEGQNREGLKDADGTLLVKIMVDEAMANGYTFLEYHFGRLGREGTFPKLGCTKHYAPWGWIVGTGEYIDNIAEDLKKSESLGRTRLNKQVVSIRFLNSYGFIIDKNNLFIAHDNQSLIGKDVHILDTETGEDLTAYFRTVKNGPVQYHYSRDGEGSHKKIGFVRYYEPEDIVIAYAVYEDDVEKAVSIIRFVLIITGLVSLILLQLMTSLILRKIARPLTDISLILMDISEGKGDLTRTVDIRSNDEIGQIAGSFNGFTGKIAHMIRDLKQVGRSSRDMGDDLSAGITEISASTTEMAATVRSLNSQVDSQSQTVDEASSHVDQIREQIKLVNSNIEAEIVSLDQSIRAVMEMIDSIHSLSNLSSQKSSMVSELNNHADNSGRAMAETAGDIREISGSVDTILELVDVINGVSDQINLLSMNAAIEAAHAGDSGRGFAVVAEEIRKLAETTGEQSGRITQSVNSIAATIKRSSENSQKTEESLRAIIDNIQDISELFSRLLKDMDGLSAGSNTVIGALNTLRESSGAVKDSADAVNRNSEVLIGNIRDVNDLSRSNSQGISEVMEGTNQISQVISELARMGNTNRDNVSVLDEKLDQFKVEETVEGAGEPDLPAE